MQARRQALLRRAAVARSERTPQRVIDALDRNAKALDRQVATMARQSDAIRDAIAELHDHEVEVKRYVNAIVGALLDLAAEVRR